MKIIDSFNFVNFYNKIKNQSMPLSTAYRLSKLYNQLADDAKFYSEKLRETIQKYAELDENGNIVYTEDGSNIKLKKDLVEECNKELDNLNNLDSTVSFDAISIDMLNTISVAPSDIDNIMGFFE